VTREHAAPTLDAAWIALPIALGRSSAALDAVLSSWATRRGLSTLACRVAPPTAIPGTEYEIWLAQLLHVKNVAHAAADLSFGVRATVALRLHQATERAAGLVFRDGLLAERIVSERDGDGAHGLTALEATVGSALAAFAGALDAAPGWLEPWLAAWRSRAEVRVIRWNGVQPPLAAWPGGYGAPDESHWSRRVDDDLERSILVKMLAPLGRTLVERFVAVESAHEQRAHDRSINDEESRGRDGAIGEVSAAEADLMAAVGSKLGAYSADELVQSALQTVLAAEGIPTRRSRRVLASIFT
jgi:hypothetical protein